MHERIVYAYDMQLDTHRISVSLTTIEIRPEGAGTRLIFTEQGTRWLLDKLGASLG